MIDLETMGLTEIIRLQNQLSQVLTRRFERRMALAFSDIVGSTPYFQRFGDQAGRKLQQRHTDILQAVLPKHDGRIVDTAGDGAFTCFMSVDGAARALIETLTTAAKDNSTLPPEHHLSLRMGIHWGPVLTDGTVVTGDAVNLCSRVAGASAPEDISLTREAFQEIIDVSTRLRCSALPPTPLKGIERQVELMRLDWRDRDLFPTHVEVVEQGETFKLPDQPTISFGRLATKDGIKANDIVLSPPDEEQRKQISRWHFELRRQPIGYTLRQLTPQVTEVDDKLVAQGAEVPIKNGSIVRVARVLTLRFFSAGLQKKGDATMYEVTNMF
jgi:class 3 adenylate cyclase